MLQEQFLEGKNCDMFLFNLFAILLWMFVSCFSFGMFRKLFVRTFESNIMFKGLLTFQVLREKVVCVLFSKREDYLELIRGRRCFLFSHGGVNWFFICKTLNIYQIILWI